MDPKGVGRLSGTRWILHSNQFSERGDSVNLLEIAGALEALGVSEVCLTFGADHPANSDERITEAQRLGLRVDPYVDGRFDRVVGAVRPTHVLTFTSGRADGNSFSSRWPHRFRFGDYVHITHAAFRNFEPHGDLYAYVSDWLHEWANEYRNALGIAGRARLVIRRPFVRLNMPTTSLPHAVTTVPGDGAGFRARYGIPATAAVIGRIGGFDQFDDPEAQRAVARLLNLDSDVWFIGVNTRPFIQHPRCVHIPFLSRREVDDFMDGIDVLLNGRLMGESFGLNIVEALQHGRPVIAPCACRNPGMDANHTLLLKERPDWLYCSAEDIHTQFHALREQEFIVDAAALIGNRFSRHALAARLVEVVPT